MSPLTDDERAWIQAHFTESVEDVLAVAAKAPDGAPLVLTVRPLRRHRRGSEPCPTQWWLADKDLKIRISRLEAAGWIARLESRLQADQKAREEVHEDHRRYAAARLQILRELDLDATEQERMARGDFDDSLRRTGIGGIRNFDAVKCLHLHYAHHLVDGSLIGSWIDQLLNEALPHEG